MTYKYWMSLADYDKTIQLRATGYAFYLYVLQGASRGIHLL